MKFVYLMRKFGVLLLASFAALVVSAGAASAADVIPGETVLPAANKALTLEHCKIIMTHVEGNSIAVKGKFADRFESPLTVNGVHLGVEGIQENDVLGCGIKTGQIKLWMVPYYIRYMLEFVLALSGLMAVGGLVYGGYLYMFGGVVEDKDKGKKAILYALGGMVLTLTSWAIVNVVVAVVSS